MKKQDEQDEDSLDKNEVAEIKEAPKISEKQLKREKFIAESKAKYNINFFKDFAFSGANQVQLSQKALEEYIINME